MLGNKKPLVNRDGFPQGSVCRNNCLVLSKKPPNDTGSQTYYIFYKIVDSIQEDDDFVLQCINTKATFRAKISEIVFDIDILLTFRSIYVRVFDFYRDQGCHYLWGSHRSV